MKINIIYLILLTTILITSCKPKTTPANKQQPITSPSGKYIFTIPIEKNTTNPQYKGTSVWKVSISSNGQIEYKDEKSTFVGYLNVYWIWDEYDRIWLYESDTSCIYFWEKIDNKWQNIKWGYGPPNGIDL